MNTLQIVPILTAGAPTKLMGWMQRTELAPDALRRASSGGAAAPPSTPTNGALEEGVYDPVKHEPTGGGRPPLPWQRGRRLLVARDL